VVSDRGWVLTTCAAIASCFCATALSQLPEDLSGELKLNVLGAYFARYVCITRFPELQPRIDRIYFSSSLRKIAVPCDGLQCTDPGLTRDLRLLFESSTHVPAAEARKMCDEEKYERAIRTTERQYATELQAIPPDANGSP
jgi:hypothetical protein